MAHYTSDTPYTKEETIVVSIDLGTTHSAVSYSYLYPGEKPEIRLVNKWPGQPEASGDSKIPSLVAYQNGVATHFGAEARDFLGDEDYEVAKWFKLHLHPDSMKISDEPPRYGSNNNAPPTIEIPPLPQNVTVGKVYADFLRYMFKSTGEFFKGNTPNGSRIWDRLRGNMVVVLATPNGWDATQQAFLRKAALEAELVTEQTVEGNLEFITEGEASVHYALAHSQSRMWMRTGSMFAVTDAGGSTVDSTLYECKSLEPLKLEEVCASQCVQAGGVFVDRAARILLEEKLANSKFSDEEYLGLMIQEFEKKTKRIFDGTQESNTIHFGRNSDNDRPHDILKGRLSLKKNDVGSTFDDVVARTIESCLKLLSGRKVKHLLLVGGFGESPFLRKRLKDMFGPQGTEVVTVDEPSKKAAAEGASIWYIKQLVKARAARYTFGTGMMQRYNPNLPHHRERERTAFIGHDGVKKIDGIFEIWVEKNAVLDNDWKKTFDYFFTYDRIPENLGEFSLQVYAWEGQGRTLWQLDTQGNLLPQMRPLCRLQADLSRLRASIRAQTGANGRKFWKVDFKVAVMLGGTRLQARLQWVENGRLCEGPVGIIPNSTF